jgi:hypothetical protein
MINVLQGPCALALGRYWIGIASGNRYAKKRRRTPERALEDAWRMEP